MRSFALLSLLAVSVPVLAQTVPAGSVVMVQRPSSQGCPVGLSARHANQGETIQVSPQERPRGQGYRLSFEPAKERGIAQVQVTLHGLAGMQVLPVGGGEAKGDGKTRSDGANATESFTIAPSAAANHLFQSTVYTKKLTGVLWVEVNEITYADGSTWHASGTEACRVAPNGYMLVAATGR